MKLSVVIPAFNAASHIADQLDALAHQTHEGCWDLVVADNGSTDDTVAIVQRWAHRIPLRVIDARSRVGAGAARNAAAAATDGDGLVFCDADDIVDTGWLAAHAAALADHPISAGAIVFFTDAPASDPPVPSRAPTLLEWMPYAQGANCAVRRAAYDAVGGFDEAYRVGEDVDLAWRLQLDGFPLAYTPDALVHKRARTGVRAQLAQGFRYGSGDVDLYRQFRDQGARRPSARAIARTYLGLLARTPALGEQAVRDRWVRQVGRRAGRLTASVRRRVFLA